MANYTDAIIRAAKKYGISPQLFLRQIKQESGGNPNARSPAGAQGIAQIMPATAKSWGVNPNDPLASIDAAAKHMGDYQRQYGGGTEGFKKALIAYNAGPGAVGKPLTAETAKYIPAIMGGGPAGQVTGPSAKGAPGFKAAGGPAGTNTTTIRTPPVDNSQARAALVSTYMQNRGRPGALMSLVAGSKEAQDQPGTSKTVTSPAGASAGAPGGSEDIVGLGKIAESMGLKVGENPAFGGVGGTHVPDSYHYKGEAIDVSGDPEKMKRFNELMAQQYGPKLKELFYNGSGGKNIKDGKPQPIGFVSGHTDHVHVAL